MHLESQKNLTWLNLNKPTTGNFGGTISPKSPILALKSLKNGRKTAEKQFLSQNDFRSINSPSKWIHKTKIRVGFFGRTDGRTFRRSSSTEVENFNPECFHFTNSLFNFHIEVFTWLVLYIRMYIETTSSFQAWPSWAYIWGVTLKDWWGEFMLFIFRIPCFSYYNHIKFEHSINISPKL